jgi:hypothetical protein
MSSVTSSWTLSTILTNRDQRANGLEEKQPDNLYLLSFRILIDLQDSGSSQFNQERPQLKDALLALSVNICTPSCSRLKTEDNHIRTLDSYLDV